MIVKTKKIATLALLAGSTVALAACGASNTSKVEEKKDDFKSMIITDVGGVSDKSFNQGAWEGLQAWGKEAGKKEGENYGYLQSNSDSDYAPNLETAVEQGSKIIFGIGFKLEQAIADAAKNHADTQFALIDSVVTEDKQPNKNVLSITFKDNEASFLAGVAAGLTTKTNTVGFIGGIHGDVIDRFEAGFVAGVKAVNPNATVQVQYADSFSDAAKGQSLAAAMYASGVDVIFHAAGGVGAGVFTEAKNLVKADPNKNIWVIGVDQDQSAEGKVDDSRNITLTSTLKGVGTAVHKFTAEAAKGTFYGGQVQVLGLKDNGVDLAEGQLSAEVKAKVAEFKKAIIDGTQTVPEKP